MIRPSSAPPQWCTTPVDPGDISAPDAAKKASGFKKVAGVPEKPPYQDFNWYMNLAYQWLLYMSAGFLSRAGVSIANNQVAPANITGLVFAPATYVAFEANLRFYVITTGPIGKTAFVKLNAAWNAQAGAWVYTQTEPTGDELSGLTLSVTAAGQVRYMSTNRANFTSATVAYQATAVPAT